MAAPTAGLAGATAGVREKQHLYTCLSIPSCCPPALEVMVSATS